MVNPVDNDRRRFAPKQASPSYSLVNGHYWVEQKRDQARSRSQPEFGQLSLHLETITTHLQETTYVLNNHPSARFGSHDASCLELRYLATDGRECNA